MKLFTREVTKRVEVNKYGKLGYRRFVEYVYTDTINEHNYGKRISFFAVAEDSPRADRESARAAMKKPDKVFCERI